MCEPHPGLALCPPPSAAQLGQVTASSQFPTPTPSFKSKGARLSAPTLHPRAQTLEEGANQPGHGPRSSLTWALGQQEPCPATPRQQ